MFIKFMRNAEDANPVFLAYPHIDSLKHGPNGSVMLRTGAGTVLTLENCDLDAIATALGWTGDTISIDAYASQAPLELAD